MLAMDRGFHFQALRKVGDSELEVLDRSFALVDRDGDGQLTFGEFRDGLRSREVSALQLFQSVDADQDGAVSNKEFVDAAQGPKEIEAFTFQRADVDQATRKTLKWQPGAAEDSFVSREEFLNDARGLAFRCHGPFWSCRSAVPWVYGG